MFLEQGNQEGYFMEEGSQKLPKKGGGRGSYLPPIFFNKLH